MTGVGLFWSARGLRAGRLGMLVVLALTNAQMVVVGAKYDTAAFSLFLVGAALQ